MDVILAGMIEGVSRKSVLAKLHLAQPDHQFNWFEANQDDLRIPDKYFRQLMHQVHADQKATVLKLYNLDYKQQNKLYECCQPVPIPREITDEATLVVHVLELLFPAWKVSAKDFSLLAILSKLLRNKSWNPDVHGHNWTQENDLLGQAPVNRKGYPESVTQARPMLNRAKKCGLLLTKGSGHGKTPKGWSINTDYLPQVKKVFLDREFAPLRTENKLADLFDNVSSGELEFFVDDGIRSPMIIAICEEREH